MMTADRTPEQVLVMKAQLGDQDAFRQLVEQYQGLVYTLAKRMLNDPQDAEDVSQEVFLSAWKALPTFRMDAKLSTWLYRLTVNAATDQLRRRKKTESTMTLDDEEHPVDLPDPTPGPQEQAERSERADRVRTALAQLTENHRRILVLREVNGLNYDEIAEVLELTPGTVKSRLARARRELREKLLAQGNEFDGFASKQKKGGEGSHGRM